MSRATGFFSVLFRRTNCQHCHVFMTRFFSKMCTDCLLALDILFPTCACQNNLKGADVTIQKMPLLSFPYINLCVCQNLDYTDLQTGPWAAVICFHISFGF